MPSPTTQPRNLLVIDDDAIMREILSAILGMEGYNVHLVESGDKAISFLAQSGAEIDVILVDLHMPGVQGKELAERLNILRAPGTPLIGMSGSRPSTDEMGIYSAFLDKPFSVEEFARAVLIAAQAEGQPSQNTHAATPQSETVLDEAIFARLAAILPQPQLRELYRITIADVLRRVDTMRAALSAGDLATCQREAHSIKGGCGMVGATAISALAGAVETAADPNQLSPADNGPSFPEFITACTRLQVMLDARFTDE